MKLSIIIPAYNVEGYIRRCLDSCLAQDVDKSGYEIIVVDDGSQDDTSGVLKEYDWRGCQHKVLCQRNQGLSAARNAGLQAAEREFIWFVDSDDWIKEDSLSRIFPLLEKEVDVVAQRALFENYPEREEVTCYEGCFQQGREAALSSFDPKVMLYVFRRDFLLELGFLFQEGIYHEDAHFMPRALYRAGKMRCLESPLYHYYHRQGSIMCSRNPKRVYDLMWILGDLLRFAEDGVSIQDRATWMGVALPGMICIMEKLSREMKDERIREEVRKFLSSEPRLSKAMSYSPYWKIRCIGMLSSWFFGGDLLGAFSLAQRLGKLSRKLALRRD